MSAHVHVRTYARSTIGRAGSCMMRMRLSVFLNEYSPTHNVILKVVPQIRASMRTALTDVAWHGTSLSDHGTGTTRKARVWIRAQRCIVSRGRSLSHHMRSNHACLSQTPATCACTSHSCVHMGKKGQIFSCLLNTYTHLMHMHAYSKHL